MNALEQALYEYTGGNFIPNVNDPCWKKLIRNLNSHNVTPREFCFFVTHHLQTSLPDMRHLLIRKAYVTGDEVWGKFIEWKAGRQKEVKLLVSLQRDTIKTYNRTFEDLYSVLSDKRLPLNPVIRVDYALLEMQRGRFEFKNIVDEYWDDAMYLVEGSPEYLECCPVIRQVKEKFK